MFSVRTWTEFSVRLAASVSNILTVRKWAEPKIVGRNFTSRIRPLTSYATAPPFNVGCPLFQWRHLANGGRPKCDCTGFIRYFAVFLAQ